jgi:DNA helicase-2/ATP-dependent DNA helicase PcrA
MTGSLRDEYPVRDHARWNTGFSVQPGKVLSESGISPQRVVKSAVADRYYKGAVVRHAKFGLGTVQRSEGTGDDLKISVSFPGHGVKTLAVKYANLEVI